MSATRIRHYINAPRSIVYRALLDPRAVAKWKVPDGMRCHVHSFDAREGGSLRVSLTYDAPTGTGKTTAHTDTYHGRFVTLVPNERIVEVDEFETDDPTLAGEMSITITLADRDGGTELHAVHEGLPPGVSPADNETGWQMALAKLTALAEAEAHQLVTPANDVERKAYHDIRRQVLFEARGQFGVYDENRPDEHGPGHHPKVLKYDGDTIGVVRIDIDGDVAILRRVAIRADVQRRGHGRALLSLAQLFAEDAGCRRLVSFVGPDAVGFYQRSGFAVDESRKTETSSAGSVFMSKATPRSR